MYFYLLFFFFRQTFYNWICRGAGNLRISLLSSSVIIKNFNYCLKRKRFLTEHRDSFSPSFGYRRSDGPNQKALSARELCLQRADGHIRYPIDSWRSILTASTGKLISCKEKDMFRCKRRFLKTFKKFEARLCRPFIQCLDFEIHDGIFINRKFFGTSDVN